MPENVSMARRIMSFVTKWGTLLVIVAMFAFFTFYLWGMFLTRDNMITILRSTSIVAIISMGMTVAVAVGGMDLSIGATAGLAMNLAAMMFFWYHQGVVVAMSVAIFFSAVCGVINGVLVVKCKIPDMLATLATSFMIQGISITIAGGGSVTRGIGRAAGGTSDGIMPQIFRDMGRSPWIILIMFAVTAVVFVFMSFTKHGRYMYVTGENIEAARLSGIAVNRYRIFAYVIAGVCAAIAGMLLASRLGSAQLGAADGYLMPAVASTFIGLSVLGAGKANAFGTLAGAFLMALMENGLIMMSVPYYSMNIFKGLVLAAALALAFFGGRK